MFKAKETDDAVSPVIGVILLVAVTVALVALATVIVFDIGSDVSDTADATVQLDQVDEGVQATVIRSENVESFALTGSMDDDIDSDEDRFTTDANEDATYDYDTDGTMSDVGDTALYPVEIWEDDSGNDEGDTELNSLEDGDTISVIAELEDGSQEVLTSTDYSA